MANSKSSSNVRNFMYSGKHALLPPKSPFPSVSSSYVDHVPSGVIGSKAIQKPRDGNAVHQRTSSETFHIDEQPSWFDDLLNEPETPVRRGGHRRSSSDSFAYVDVANTSNLDYAAKDDYYRVRSPIGTPSWGPQNFDYLGNVRKTLPYAEVIANLSNQKHSAWDSMNAPSLSGGLPSGRENVAPQSSKTLNVVSEADTLKSSSSEKQDIVESEQVDSKTSSESKDGSHAKSSTSEADTKRAKQQFAQRSRVRKLQYIAELERNVQALQAEGSGVSAELEFLNHRNIILNMENKALKQRLESLTQEQLIKYYEHEILEKEIARLRALYKQQQEQQLQTQQQQQQQKPSSSHRRNSSRDLDSQLASLSLKHRDSNNSHDPTNGPLRT